MKVARVRPYAFTLAAAALLCASSSQAETRRFGLVVGSNDPGDSGLQPLDYADDDAFRNHEVLTLLGVQAVLLVSPDQATRQRYLPTGAAPAGPTRTNLTRALREIFDQARAVRAAGHEVEF